MSCTDKNQLCAIIREETRKIEDILVENVIDRIKLEQEKENPKRMQEIKNVAFKASSVHVLSDVFNNWIMSHPQCQIVSLDIHEEGRKSFAMSVYYKYPSS